MMKTNKYIIVLISTALFSLTGCTDWLEQEPMSQVTTAVYFKNAEQFQNAANKLADECYGFGRNFTSNESFSIFFDYGTDLIGRSSDEISGLNGAPTSESYYEKSYKALRNINNLLDQSKNYTGTENIDQPVGQALFYRAFWHFFLLKRYGGITLATYAPETNSDMILAPRNSRYEVVQQILDDLDEAISRLKNTTKSSTGNNGQVTIEAANALKARVCLFEGTWEKYNGRGNADETNGDGIQSGAGTVIPDNYPSIESLLTMAKECSGKFVEGGEYGNEYAVWMPDEELSGYENQAAYYYFILEDAASNPYGLDKSSNDEAIFRLIFDYDKNKKSGQNLSHTAPVSGTRKLMDMFLCKDGLPVHKSKLFNGYKGLNTEFENRDSRMTALFKRVDYCYWGYAGSGKGNPSDYTTTPDLGNGGIGYIPKLSAYSANDIAYEGRKFVVSNYYILSYIIDVIYCYTERYCIFSINQLIDIYSVGKLLSFCPLVCIFALYDMVKGIYLL